MIKQSHLDELESEAIHIIRESVAESSNPVMMFSIGKDSTVLLHLAKKAFYPLPPPFPLLHIDTGWKFKEMYDFKRKLMDIEDINLRTWTNERWNGKTNPLEDSDHHTKVMKTDALKAALNHYGHDYIICGARRDEDASRSKERIYSFRNKFHTWDYKNQRPEPWNYLNGKMRTGESVRVFPLSNWTEYDIWEYINRENIDIVPLYFAKPRKVINKRGTWILYDDDRVLEAGDVVEEKVVRFRTLGCYPLTGAIESNATTLDEVIAETTASTVSERKDRLIDTDETCMEDKKINGYF